MPMRSARWARSACSVPVLVNQRSQAEELETTVRKSHLRQQHDDNYARMNLPNARPLHELPSKLVYTC